VPYPIPAFRYLVENLSAHIALFYHFSPFVIASLFVVIASEGVAISGKQNSKIKKQDDRAKMKKVSMKLKADS
jgi:hypothetical protein